MLQSIGIRQAIRRPGDSDLLGDGTTQGNEAERFM